MDLKLTKILFVTKGTPLDKELDVALLKGEIWISEVENSGHNIMEDAPDKVAFDIRNTIKNLKIPVSWKDTELKITNLSGKEVIIHR